MCEWDSCVLSMQKCFWLFEKDLFLILFFMENPLVSATVKSLNHVFLEIWLPLSKVNCTFQKMWICVSHLKTCDKIRKKSKNTLFWKNLEKNGTFEEICLLEDILFLKKTGLGGSGFPESAKIDRFETAPSWQNLWGGSLCFFHIANDLVTCSELYSEFILLR